MGHIVQISANTTNTNSNKNNAHFEKKTVFVMVFGTRRITRSTMRFLTNV